MAKKRKPKPVATKPSPVCKAILLCDAILADPFSQKASLIGIFERFIIDEFPGTTRLFFVYVNMTNGIGSYKIGMEVTEIDQGTPIARIDELAKMEFADRWTRNILFIPVPQIPLPRPGKYDFIVYADGHEVDRQTFEAVQRPGEPNDQNERRPRKKPK